MLLAKPGRGQSGVMSLLSYPFLNICKYIDSIGNIKMLEKPFHRFTKINLLHHSRFVSTKRQLQGSPDIEYSDKNIKVVSNQAFTNFTFANPQKTVSLNNTFLRDASQGFLSIDPNSGQKLFTTASIIGQFPKSVTIPDEETVRIEWIDGETSNYGLKDFFDQKSSLKSIQNDIIVWDSCNKQEEKFPVISNLTHDYSDYMIKDLVLKQVIEDLNKFGFSIINNLPEKSDKDHNSEPIVKKLAERIGYVKETFYGAIFDVRSKPDAENIAYTDKFLPLHQDLLYYESPPGLQLLHFIKNRAVGGQNVLSDGFAAARHVKNSDPEAYSALLQVPINFHYEKDGHSYFQARPLVVENSSTKNFIIHEDRSQFKEVNYSPPFQAPFDLGIATYHSTEDSYASGEKNFGNLHVFEDFLRGLRLFEEYINSKENRLKFKTPEGSCIIFDNRRILHARDAFDSQSGERWLKGCYIDRDTFLSKTRVLN